MARKAIVDRNTVLQLLKEGKTSQNYCNPIWCQPAGD